MLNKVSKYIKDEQLFKRLIIFFIGVFLLALNYNLFIVPNNFILGGAGGTAVILENLFNFNHIITIYVINAILLVLSFIFLDKKDTRRAIVGSLLYPTMISITSPLCDMIIPYLTFNSFIITIALCGILNGIAGGLIYKVGYNTGGGDIIIKLVNKYIKMTEGNTSLMVNGVIILCGGVVFGLTNIIYSIIIITISSTILDKILIGISDCKMFFIYSKKYKAIEKFILEDLHTGVTSFNTEGAYKKGKREMLMVVIPTRDYYLVKQHILKIDEDAFFTVTDCYEVNGGIKRKNLPFI